MLIRRGLVLSCVLFLITLCSPHTIKAQENPYFVAYDHYIEEPGNLEIEYFSTFGTQRAGNDFHSFWTEFEYGATAWWTTEFYLDGQTTFGDNTIFTGIRWENRFRPLKREHFINPILYVEYEHKSAADKILKEGEGHDVESDFLTPNAQARRDIRNEMELKLILSSTFKGWNFTENTLAAKDLSNSPWEFGYALGASRPLALKASAKRCTLCPQNFVAGVEMSKLTASVLWSAGPFGTANENPGQYALTVHASYRHLWSLHRAGKTKREFHV